jgi:hypothetical protein
MNNVLLSCSEHVDSPLWHRISGLDVIFAVSTATSKQFSVVCFDLVCAIPLDLRSWGTLISGLNVHLGYPVPDDYSIPYHDALHDIFALGEYLFTVPPEVAKDYLPRGYLQYVSQTP